MKLYTEEQVKEMIDDAHNGIDGYYDIFKKHTTIELPSDEEIHNECQIGCMDTNQQLCFQLGAKWIRDKIQDISKKETTAVEWLVKELNLEGYDYTVQQAKQMEKEQIVDAFYEGMQANTFDQNKGRALMYYNETYNQ